MQRIDFHAEGLVYLIRVILILLFKQIVPGDKLPCSGAGCAGPAALKEPHVNQAVSINNVQFLEGKT